MKVKGELQFSSLRVKVKVSGDALDWGGTGSKVMVNGEGELNSIIRECGNS